MKIEIDQSGKVENTNKSTVVAFSNGKSDVLVILAKDKKKVQEYFRGIGKPRLFIRITFVALIFILIKKHIKNRDQIVIDREYPGYERFISKTLKLWIEANLRIKGINITTLQIGKKSNAHDLSWQELRHKSHNISKRIDAAKIIKLIESNKKSGSV